MFDFFGRLAISALYGPRSAPNWDLYAPAHQQKLEKELATQARMHQLAQQPSSVELLQGHFFPSHSDNCRSQWSGSVNRATNRQK